MKQNCRTQWKDPPFQSFRQQQTLRSVKKIMKMAQTNCTELHASYRKHGGTYVEIKCQLDATEVFIADLIACSTCFGHHYAHHQELKSIIQCVRFAECCKPDTILSFTTDQQLENHSTKYHRQQPLYNTLELLMMGIRVPETCWASNRICNKNLCCI